MGKTKATSTADLEIKDLIVGHVYRSKKPKMDGLFDPLVDDRQIIYVSDVKHVIETKDHGFTEDFKNWCSVPGTYRYTGSILDQDKYEAETNKPCRNLETIWDYIVQYDSPTVRHGKNYPKITATKFIKWAGKDVTNIMPKGEWAKSF